MKFNMSPEWCERNARKEAGMDIAAGKRMEVCPVCRNSNLEKSWCDTCNRAGVVLVNREGRNHDHR